MAGVVWIQWYASVLRHEPLAQDVARVAPLALRYGATQYSVHQSLDDRYRITQMSWFESKEDWYAYWDGPEMIEFRRPQLRALPDSRDLRLAGRARLRRARSRGPARAPARA